MHSIFYLSVNILMQEKFLLHLHYVFTILIKLLITTCLFVTFEFKV